MKVLIADDHPLVRNGLKAVLVDFTPDVEVVEVVDFPHALQQAERYREDLMLILLDLTMPGAERSTSVRLMVRQCPAVPVVVLSGSEETGDVRMSLACGAAGYIPKSSATPIVLSARRLVLAGGIYVPPAVLAAENDTRNDRDATPAPDRTGLTGRQVEVLTLMRRGKSNKEIARVLGIAESTVKAHVSGILKTLRVTSRAKAVLASENAP
ncbi:MAG: response regulator [Rhodospirillaceae bacterium]|nr:MAG: response regulator [Rhodospirillaceae bacterium]